MNSSERKQKAMDRYNRWFDNIKSAGLDENLTAIEFLQLVNTKQALELRDLGFNWGDENGRSRVFYAPSKTNPEFMDRVWRPTCQLVFKWVRLNHNMSVEIVKVGKDDWWRVTIWVDDKVKMMDNIETGILNALVIDSYREEARTYTTDSLISNLAEFENNVENRLKEVFKVKFFQLNSLTSGLKPPSSMDTKIQDKNNVSQEVQTGRNQIELLKVELEKQKIQAEINRTISSGLDDKILKFMLIEAIRYGGNQKTVFADPKILGLSAF